MITPQLEKSLSPPLLPVAPPFPPLFFLSILFFFTPTFLCADDCDLGALLFLKRDLYGVG